MDEEWFRIPFSQGFHSPQAAMLHKARYLEENLDAVNESFKPFSEFVFRNDKSADSFDQLQPFIAKSKASFEDEGRASSSASSTQAALLKMDNFKTIPSELSKIIPSVYNVQKRKPERSQRHAFKTRSESDILEDGYKWRKYGKKFIKGNPNPRNYYRCSYSNCDVKKRVQRDAQDKGIVITTYEGKHNHESSTTVYYITNPPIFVAEQASCLDNYPPPFSYSSHRPTDFMFINTS
ncbi:hypothetical protein SUGI_0321670 [Cryptomeria japonica]|uniref:probable WRKY transcription factor 56 n=1 Tax=Cryptomeria japonica TaxID=3369 RepID=UPI00240894BD|nr:probable WRKY transcription factor 56 [Cryptomeria japonica]GLJ18196.1 hypothetical protein SUGI_0321670 [Cryptomeria japonica]